MHSTVARIRSASLEFPAPISKGSAPGEMDGPHTLAMDSRGRLFLGDRGNNAGPAASSSNRNPYPRTMTAGNAASGSGA
jgi:hypothetical protein